MRVIEGLYDGVSTSELDNLAAETAASMTIAHQIMHNGSENCDFNSNTTKSFSETMTEMFEYVNQRNGQYAPLIADDVYKVIQDNAEF
jgi:ribonucleoside-diphosphate reductase alpha chain